MKNQCIMCGRLKFFPKEGRIVDGGKWVCSVKCYKQLIQKRIKHRTERQKGEKR